MLQPQTGPALLRGRLFAALALTAGGIRHGVAFVEDDDAIEIRAQPIDDLPDARDLLLARIGAQRGVGGEKDALLQPDRRALAEARQRRDQQPFLPSADQSRCASSISLSDLEIHRARRRPFSQLSRMMPATWRPLPAPVPSPRNQPRRKRMAARHRRAQPRPDRRSRRRSRIRRDGRHAPRRHR